MTDTAIKSSFENRWTSPLALICYFAALKILIHFVFNSGYGYFRDELYFFACGEHLDWGYVDHAPLIGFAAKISRAIFGDSLFAIRFFSAVAGALKVLLTGLMARELGGKRFAIIIACLCVLLAPSYLVIDNMLSMNAFEPVFWMGCVYSLMLIINRNEPRYWIVFGLLAGAGLMNKHSMLFFGVAIVVGLLFTNARSFLFNRWLLIGGAIAFLIFLPNIIWQWRHDWATIELLKNVKATGKNVELSPFDFILRQILGLSPIAAPVWIAGLFYFLFDGEGKRFRALGVTYLILLLIMILLSGKDYYLFPIYPMLFAGGGMFVERLLENRKRLGWLKIAYPVLLVVTALILMPLALPVLPVEKLIAYQNFLGFKPPKSEVGHTGPLPQYFGDQFGWEEMVEKVARAYNKLLPEEKSKTAIYGSNYGEAGAIDFFGAKYGLPKAISPHQSYFLWGPRDYTGEIVIVLQGEREELEQQFNSVEEAEKVGHPYGMGEEHYTIFVCRGLKQPLGGLWQKLKHWN